MVVLDYGGGGRFGGWGLAEGLLLLDVVGEVAEGLMGGVRFCSIDIWGVP